MSYAVGDLRMPLWLALAVRGAARWSRRLVGRATASQRAPTTDPERGRPSAPPVLLDSRSSSPSSQGAHRPMKALVTGASGFVGHHLVAHLEARATR